VGLWFDARSARRSYAVIGAGGMAGSLLRGLATRFLVVGLGAARAALPPGVLTPAARALPAPAPAAPPLPPGPPRRPPAGAAPLPPPLPPPRRPFRRPHRLRRLRLPRRRLPASRRVFTGGALWRPERRRRSRRHRLPAPPHAAPPRARRALRVPRH